MTTKNTISPAKKLKGIREKMMALQRQETKICRDLSQDLSKILINAQALEINFDILTGGILDVISQAKTDTNKAELWRNAGQKFLRNQIRRGQEKEHNQKEIL